MPLGQGSPLPSTMEFVTLEHVARVTERSPETGKYLDISGAARLSAQYVWLYDPPVDGATPLDGAGEPSVSAIQASAAKDALLKGFTADVVKPTKAAAPEAKARK